MFAINRLCCLGVPVSASKRLEIGSGCDVRSRLLWMISVGVRIFVGF